MKTTRSLVEQLRRVDELAFLNWETFDEDLLKRLLIAPHIRNGCFAKAASTLDWAVTDEEVLLAVVKSEARRRAQRDLYILLLYYPGQNVTFTRGQIEGMFKAAGLDSSLPTSQLIMRALELYRESGAPPMNYSEWPQVILDQPALAKVPALTESERIHLLALEASLAVIDRVRATELAHAGTDPEDPLLDRLQRLEEQAIALFIAHTIDDGENEPNGDLEESRAHRSARGGDTQAFPVAVAEILAPAFREFGPAENTLTTLERELEFPARLGLPSRRDGPPSDEERRHLLALLHKALILETERFLNIPDEELSLAITRLEGNVEDLLPCKLRLLLIELQTMQPESKTR